MRLFHLSWLLIPALLALVACESETEPETVTPSYRWIAADVQWAQVYPDSIVPEEPCYVDYVFGKKYGSCSDAFPPPYEGAWNCTQRYMERRGDTVFLRAFAATGPNENWKTTFECLDRFEPFVLQPDGRGLYVGESDLGGDPEVRLSGDTLRFKMTFMLFDRSKTCEIGANTQEWIRFHAYGVQFDDLDSLQHALLNYCKDYQYCLDKDYSFNTPLVDSNSPDCIQYDFCKDLTYHFGGPAQYMVAWRDFIYVASDSVLTEPR